jgi:uncharacterized protein (TIGR02599 family)
MILMTVILAVTNQTGKLWRGTTSKIASFQDARAAFDALTRNLTQATLNHYYDYYDTNWKTRPADTTSADYAAFTPANYGRASDLQFLCGPADSVFGSSAGARQGHAIFFQAPLGRVADKAVYSESPSLVNALGYYVEFSDNTSASARPKFLQNATAMKHLRFRLMEWVQPSEKFRLYYNNTLPTADPKEWFLTLTSNPDQCRVLADNVLALIILPLSRTGNATQPRDTTLAPAYGYDSRPLTYDLLRSHLLPPMLQVTMVAIDRESAARLNQQYKETMPPYYSPKWFTKADSYDDDLKALENALQGRTGLPKVNYRIFTTIINTRDYK